MIFYQKKIKKNIYHVNEKKKIEKIINDFNYDIDKNE